jgi:vacuolar protein sorting-associated protein 18
MFYNQDIEAFYIYSNRSIAKIDLQNENRDAWKVFLDNKQFDQAYQICVDHSIPNENYIGRLYGDQLFDQQKYSEAARIYFQTDQNFEEILIKFLGQSKKDWNAEEGTQVYLTLWLDHYKTQKNSPQFVAILGLLVEMKLYQLNYLERQESQEGSKTESKTKSDKFLKTKQIFQNFLLQNVENDEVLVNLVNQLMQTHGRLNEIVEFAEKKNAHETVITHYINGK